MADYKPMALREGKVIIDGEVVMEAVKLDLMVSIATAEYKPIGGRNTNYKIIGYDCSGELTEFKTTPRWKNLFKEYDRSGIFPTLTITGIANDKNSDYFQKHGEDKTTIEGMVIDGDLPLTSIDTDGELNQTTISLKGGKIIE